MIPVMQARTLNWAELAKIVGPYISGGVAAIVAAVATAKFTYQNWLKQFAVERAEVMRRERIRILEEVPLKVIRTFRLASNAVEQRALVFAVSQLIKEHFLAPEAHSRLIEFDKQFYEVSAQVQDMFAELSALSVSLSVYFGEKSSQVFTSVTQSLGALGRYDSPYSEGLRKLTYETLKSVGSIDLATLGAAHHDEYRSALNNIMPELQQVIESMLEELPSLER